MPPRQLLRSHLAAAWKSTILDAYEDQLINSERGFQVYFCHALLNAFQGAGVRRRLFVEPKLCAPSTGERRYPDIVICNTRNVIGLVEIKYLPRAVPSTEKDLQTFEFAVKHRDELVISNDRHRGTKGAPRPYPLAADAVLCWCGVYTGEPLHLRRALGPHVTKHFLQLDALTKSGNSPIIFVDGHAISNPAYMDSPRSQEN